PTKIVRINGVYTKWAYRDIITLAEAVGDLIDGFMIPKVETANDVTFVADLLRMIEDTTGLTKKLGLEVQIETALGLQHIRERARSATTASGRCIPTRFRSSTRCSVRRRRSTTKPKRSSSTTSTSPRSSARAP